MKTQGNFGLKHLILVLALVGFALPSRAHVIFEEIHYQHPHQYVYYPKQNFYYDPVFGQYIVVENGVWVRQPYPPRLLRKININILPHTDIYMTTMYPYRYNAEHRRRFHLMAVLTPSTAFYAFKMPNRYDFTIGASVYYCSPSVDVVFVDYNPNYYCHPFAVPPGHRRHHHYDDPYNYLVVYARNDYYDFHHMPHPYYNHYYGRPGHERYAFGPERRDYDHPYNHGYGRPGAPHGNPHGKENRFEQSNHGAFQDQRPNGPQPGHGNPGNGHGKHPGGGFAMPNQGPAPQYQNRPQHGQGNNGHGNQGGGKRTRAEVQSPDIRQGNPKEPNGFQRTINSATTVAVKALDKPNRNQDQNKGMHQKDVVLKHQFDYINRENNNSIRQR